MDKIDSRKNLCFGIDLVIIDFEVKWFIFGNLIWEVIYVWIVLIKITFRCIIYKELSKINSGGIEKWRIFSSTKNQFWDYNWFWLWEIKQEQKIKIELIFPSQNQLLYAQKGIKTC